jgi:BON domain
MRRTRTIVAVGVGAVLMYLLDPDRGKVRRASVRDRTMHAARLAGRWTRNLTLDVLNHTRGLIAESWARMLWQRPSDPVLVERVRSELGRVVRHPHRVNVTADTGWIRLSGDVLPDERESLVTAIRNIPGVLGVDDILDERGWVDAQPEPQDRPAAASA